MSTFFYSNPHPDANIIEWLSQISRSLRMKEIEYANLRQYEKAIEMREKMREVMAEVRQLYPHLFFKE